jgi:hypothetical protein
MGDKTYCPKCKEEAEDLISLEYSHICKDCGIKFKMEKLKRTPR